jgi:hypothetical protein
MDVLHRRKRTPLRLMALPALCALAVALPQKSRAQQTTTATGWRVNTYEHVDLWLHGFAMLQTDTTKVPYFRRGYRDDQLARRRAANVVTMLDANRDKLQARFAAFPNLVSAQFVALYFQSWDELRQAIDLFLRANGIPITGDANARQVIATLAGYFPTAEDRDWLRLFSQSLEDERTKYYDSYWNAAQRERAATLTRLDSLWQNVDRPKLQKYLNNTRQETGDFLLSLPLDGEGRTIQIGRLNLVTTTFPDSPANAEEAVYVFAHEIATAVVNPAVTDNITPAQKRAGLADQIASPAAVRTGLMILQKLAPTLADGYARYKLRSANVTGADGDAVRALEQAFPLPDAIRDGIARQLDVVLGGI